jgi:uncharacterized membrane protein YccC
VAACVFGVFYSAAVSYSWMTFFVTVMAGSLYGLLGVLHPGLLALRMEETGAGALAAALAVLLVLPVTTHAATDAWIQRALHTVREAAASLDDTHGAGVAARAAELDVVLGRVRASVAPLVHPLSPLRARRHRARRVLELLDACAHQVRGLAETAAHPGAGQDERLRTACRRVEHAVLRLVAPADAGTRGVAPALVRAPAPAAGSRPASAAAPEPVGYGTAQQEAAEEAAHAAPAACPRAERALAHLHGLESALADLAGPLHARPGPTGPDRALVAA